MGECRTVYESSCSTKYREAEGNQGKFLADTSCEKLPVKICGAGCNYVDGDEECHDKVITTIVNIPEEICDLNPQKSCRFATKLVPKLDPVRECTVVPKETCRMVFAKPKVVKKPLETVWCLDQSEVEDQSEEKERTSVGFLSSGRKANLSQLELDDIFEEELEINSLGLDQSESTEDHIKSEITLEKEFVEFPTQDFSENLLDF